MQDSQDIFISVQALQIKRRSTIKKRKRENSISQCRIRNRSVRLDFRVYLKVVKKVNEKKLSKNCALKDNTRSILARTNHLRASKWDFFILCSHFINDKILTFIPQI